MQGAFPEVAQLVRTVQLSHKILFKKGAFIAELAQTGESKDPALRGGMRLRLQSLHV